MPVCADCHEEIFFGPRGCWCTRQAAREHAKKELEKLVVDVSRILNEAEMESLKEALKDMLKK